MRRALFFIAFFWWLAPCAFATCAGVYLEDSAPRFVSSTTPAQAQELCSDAFGVEYSPLTRTPLWAGEHLSAQSVESARALPRRDRFEADSRLARNQRAELGDYVHSGFDRGHLAPSGDMPTLAAQAQSFRLSNVAPQAASLNRGAWEEIEAATRDLAVRNGEVFVITGVVFARAARAFINNRVRVPDQIFKAVYDPQSGEAGVYIAANAPRSRLRVISLSQLQRLIGVDMFPALQAQAKAEASDVLHLTRARYASSAGAIGQY